MPVPWFLTFSTGEKKLKCTTAFSHVGHLKHPGTASLQHDFISITTLRIITIDFY